MTQKVLAKQAGGASGGIIQAENSGGFVGENEKPREQPADMSASGTRQNLSDTPTLTSGGEPKSVLLALIWSPLETLLARKDARVFVGKDSVAVIFRRTALDKSDGLVPTVLAESEKE